GMPALGVEGAAIATVIARITEFTIVLIFMLKFEKKIKFRPKHFKVIDKLIQKDYIKTCTPVIFNEFLWSTGSSMIAVVVGRLGTEVVAANSINTVTNQFVTVFIFGISSAAGVIIGNTIGEGKLEQAKEYAITLTALVAGLGLLAGGITFMVRPYVVQFYNVSDLTKSIAMDIMGVTSIIVFFQALAATTMMGILRGGGDVKFVLVSDVIFMWIVAIPFGFLAAFWWQLPVTAVFFILKSDEILKVMVSLVRLLSGKWVKEVTRETVAISEAAS
ncbi:MAG: MATE family efflux transporter, partial [Cellulosilyticaceae bacterium]